MDLQLTPKQPQKTTKSKMAPNTMNTSAALPSNFSRSRLFKNFSDELWVAECKKNVHVSFMIRNGSCVPFIYLHVSISSEWSHTCFNFIYLLESGQFFWRVPSLNQAAMISNRPTRTWRTVLPPDIPPPPAENVCICKCYLICSLLI